jgi:DNA-binding MarR family transcriptional regulator
VNSEEKELEILESIYNAPSSIRQRDLAEIVGLSLGMTNAILKRLVTKGWLKIRKVNNRNIRYAVSSAGVEAISRRSYRYFKRTIRNVVFYKESIDELVRSGKEQGFEGIFLKGHSDLDFIVEHSCRKHGLDYIDDFESYGGRAYTIYAESYIPDAETRKKGTSFLQELFVVS